MRSGLLNSDLWRSDTFQILMSMRAMLGVLLAAASAWATLGSAQEAKAAWTRSSSVRSLLVSSIRRSSTICRSES